MEFILGLLVAVLFFGRLIFVFVRLDGLQTLLFDQVSDFLPNDLSELFQLLFFVVSEESLETAFLRFLIEVRTYFICEKFEEIGLRLISVLDLLVRNLVAEFQVWDFVLFGFLLRKLRDIFNLLSS